MQKTVLNCLILFCLFLFFPWNRKSSSWDSWRRKSRDRRISCSLFLFGWGGTERGFTAFQRLLRSSLLSLLSWEKPFTDCHQHPMPKLAERGLQSFVGVGKAVRWMAVWYLGWDTEAHAYTWVGTLDLFVSMWHAFLLAIRVGAPGGVKDNQCAGTWTAWEMLVAPGFSCRVHFYGSLAPDAFIDRSRAANSGWYGCSNNMKRMKFGGSWQMLLFSFWIE